MKARLWFAFFAGILICQAAPAQATHPSGSTGQCNDGTYTSSSAKKGSCRGHQGVKEWYATNGPASGPSQAAMTSGAAAAPAPAAPAPAAASPSSPARNTAGGSSRTPAPGGGPGLVWLNTSSNVYHCQGTAYYGTTKAGKYMTEADAKTAGAHADHGRACGK